MADSRIRAVCFDLDGTLLDTLADLADSMNTALASFGFAPHPPEAYRFLVGDGVDVLARRVLPPEQRDEEAPWKALVAAMRAEYALRWRDRTRPYPGIPELLAEVSGRGLAMAVLSNKPDDFTKAQVSHFFPDLPFAQVAGARPDEPKKPDPAAALHIAEALGLPPDRWLYLGDTDTDMKTAVGAGMTPCGACWGFRSSGELRAAGARHLLEAPADLLALL
jgi:phosphoglycolate phosphatase